MTRLIATIALLLTILLAGCAPEPQSHQPTIYQWQTTVDQGW